MKTENRKVHVAASHTSCRCDLAEHKRAALVALCRAALEVDELRDVLESAHRHRPEPMRDELEDIVDQVEARLHDEGRALGTFEDEYDCGCGRHGASEDVSDFEDEEAARSKTEPQVEAASHRRPAGLLATFLGALGVACAVASIVLRGEPAKSAE
jgi:hypothetical protein